MSHVTIMCPVCEKKMTMSPGDYKSRLLQSKSKKLYCSRECFTETLKGLSTVKINVFVNEQKKK